MLPNSLPDPLICFDGEPVVSSELWRLKRRPELLSAFQTNIYGRSPAKPPEAQTFSVLGEFSAFGGAAVGHHVLLTLSGLNKTHTAPFTLFVPTNASVPCPVFVFIDNRNTNGPNQAREGEPWPAQMVARGYAACVFQTGAFDPDSAEGYNDGVRAAFDTDQTGESWGAVAAWAWGASRILDYLETVSAIDTKRAAVVGHSRGGKAALWCGATDERFALTVSNSSGCTGAALVRGKKGETVADINTRFPYWFCPNYRKFNGRETDLPVDQHELLACIAPRLLYVASATEDTWADPPSEFAACVAAGSVFRLWGKRGVSVDKLPAPETRLHAGTIGYHLRTGKHDLTAYDWQQFMDFADVHLR